MHLGAILFRLTGAIQTSIQGNGMRPPFKRLLLCAWAAIACSGPAFAGDQIWVSDTAGAIGKIDVVTRLVTVVGNTGLSLQDIAFNPSGELFGITASALYQLDVSTGAPTFIGSLGASLTSLVFAADGTLYGSNTALYSINPDTATTTLIGNGGTSYGSSGDLAFVGGRLLLTAPTPAATGDRLVELSTVTGAGTVVGVLGTGIFARGLASPDGVRLYVAAGPSIYTLNAATGAAVTGFNVAGAGLASATGAAFATEAVAVPEPATAALWLVGAGLLSAVALRNRRRR